jgi:hypothetical protein
MCCSPDLDRIEEKCHGAAAQPARGVGGKADTVI